MDELLPYEKELSKQLSDLPLPDEDVSWEDMRRRLDDDGDDGVIIPPASSGCFGYGLLIILLAVVAWFIVRPDKWLWNKNEKNITSSAKIFRKRNNEDTVTNKTKDFKKNSGRNEYLTPEKNVDSAAYTTRKHITRDLVRTKNKEDAQRKKISEEAVIIKRYAKSSNHTNNTSEEKITDGYIKKTRHNKKMPRPVSGGLKNETFPGTQEAMDSLKNHEKNNTADKVSTTTNEPINIDSVTKKQIDSNAVKKKKDTATAAKNVKQDSAVKKIIYFGAGIAINQQLPVDGQNLVPYNSLGRKGTFTDYIPSIYFRIYKDQKWFVQSEFRYGAPQYTKEILYAQKKVVDSSSNTTLSTTNRLKKTYYHQLPVSFNYFFLSHFSIGAGLIWNKFSSAVSEQEIVKTNNTTQIDSILGKTIFHSRKADSNFIKSYFQALAEAQYQWKRWSFGAKFSFGLNPYIKFQLPGGENHEEKNSSLQIFIRYDLWQSKKK